jgi:hypothetical protein
VFPSSTVLTRDLAFSGFHVFGTLKAELCGRKFRGDEVQVAVNDWMCKQPTDFFFFSKVIQALVKRCDECLERHLDYVEK